METPYNLYKAPSAEPSLKRNIVPDAKRSKNFTSLPWRAQPDSLWGHLPDSSVLQKTEIKIVFAKKRFLSLSVSVIARLGYPNKYAFKGTLNHIIQNIKKRSHYKFSSLCCVFRSKPATYSDANRPGIPKQTSHPFDRVSDAG